MALFRLIMTAILIGWVIQVTSFDAVLTVLVAVCLLDFFGKNQKVRTDKKKIFLSRIERVCVNGCKFCKVDEFNIPRCHGKFENSKDMQKVQGAGIECAKIIDFCELDCVELVNKIERGMI